MWEEPKMAIRVHLADDHTMFREGLESILASRGGGIEVVGRSSTGGEDALALIEENKPGVVIAQIDVDLTAGFSVVDPHCMMRTYGPAEGLTQPLLHAWRLWVNINATRCYHCRSAR